MGRDDIDFDLHLGRITRAYERLKGNLADSPGVFNYGSIRSDANLLIYFTELLIMEIEREQSKMQKPLF